MKLLFLLQLQWARWGGEEKAVAISLTPRSIQQEFLNKDYEMIEEKLVVFSFDTLKEVKQRARDWDRERSCERRKSYSSNIHLVLWEQMGSQLALALSLELLGGLSRQTSLG